MRLKTSVHAKKNLNDGTVRARVVAKGNYEK
jgi:hypothetical protein